METIKRLMVYMGETPNGFRYGHLSNIEQNNGEPFSDVTSLTRKKLGKTVIGGIYEYELTGTAISYKDNQESIGFWKNNVDLIQWRLSERTFKLSKQELKQNADISLKSLLAPLTTFYRNSSPDQKALILAEVIKIITK